MSKKLPVLDPLAAFVDVGSERMHVSVGGDTPQVFGTVTSQLNALRDWLLKQGVHSVAMEQPVSIGYRSTRYSSTPT